MTESIRAGGGFILSLVSVVLTGFFLAFNVYAIPMKERFHLNQTQVELVGSFTIGGLIFVFVGALIFKKFGHRACYTASILLVTSSGLLVWVATKFHEFFGRWVGLICLLQLINSAGMIFSQNCSIAVGVPLFRKQHEATVIGIYFGTAGFGKIYYGLLFEYVFKTPENLGHFYLCVTAGVFLTTTGCMVLHRPSVPTENQNEDAELILTERKAYTDEDISDAGKLMTVSKLLKSVNAHAVFWPSLLCVSSAVSIMNNVTMLAESIGVSDPGRTVYVMATGIIVSRIALGFAFDRFRTLLVGHVMLLVIFLNLAVAMLLGLVVLSKTCIYVICTMVSVAVGSLVSLAIGILTSLSGPQHIFFITALFEIVLSPLALIFQFFVGVTYEQMLAHQSEASALCSQCFHPTFILFLSVASISGFLIMTNLCKLWYQSKLSPKS